MDDQTTKTIIAQIPGYQLWQARSYIGLAGRMALLYHYVITFGEEVKYIWPQPTWKLGKVLFLTTRYSSILALVSDFTTSTPNFANISVSGCQFGNHASQIPGMVARMSAEGTLWLCLYALLEGKTKYLHLLVIGFLSFTIAVQVLQSFYIFSPKVAALVGFITITICYRKQNHSLIRVIWREGGMYYVSALALLFAVSLASTPGVPVKDKYSVVGPTRLVLINMFVERLILRMKGVDDPGTPACVSTLIFDRAAAGNDSGSESDGISEAVSDETNSEKPEPSGTLPA